MTGDVREFVLPDLGEGLTEAEIVRWLVRVGDRVSVDQPVVEVETAKAVVEVPCPYAGVVTRLWGREGESLDVGLTACVDRWEAGSVARGCDYGFGGLGKRTGRLRHFRIRSSSAAGPPSVSPCGGCRACRGEGAPTGPVRVISPLVRRLARQHSIDLRTVRGSGPGGLILRKDVERTNGVSYRDASQPRTSPAPSGEPAVCPTGQAVRIPLRGARRAIADKLTRSHLEIPDATTWVDVDATRLLDIRQQLSASGNAKISLFALLARICVAGLAEYPELNATMDNSSQEIVRLPAIHLGFAAQTERGLFVPVIRNAQAMKLPGLSAEIARLTTSAREGTLAPTDLSGGTFTLNNYGVFGVDGSTPIINHPEAAMLGVGRILPRPWVVDGELAVRQMCQLSFTFDHRVCDGGAAGGFLRLVADLIEQPLSLLRML